VRHSAETLGALIEQRAPGEWIDVRDADLTDADLSGMRFERFIFGSHGPAGDPEPAVLRRTRFRGCTFVDCKLAHVHCIRTDFRLARLEDCDLRYASFARATLANAKLAGCDFYRATFEEAVVFEDAVLERTSLSKASLGGVVDLERGTFERGTPPALVQEDPDRYAEFLQRTLSDRPGDVREAIAGRLTEAALTYRTLSGLWTAQGCLPDAAWAYVRAKRLERASASPWHRGTPTHGLRWLRLTAADLLCSFGESLGRVVVWIGALALLPGVGYWTAGGVEDTSGGANAGLPDSLLFSASRLTASTPERLSPATALVDWIGAAQTLFGIALIGLLGFVLGNRLRSS